MKAILLSICVVLLGFSATCLAANGISNSKENIPNYKPDQMDNVFTATKDIVVDTNNYNFDGTPYILSKKYKLIFAVTHCDVIPQLDACAETLVSYNWQDISDKFASTKATFKNIEDKFGKFKLSEAQEGVSNKNSIRYVNIEFEKFVDVEDVVKATLLIDGVVFSDMLGNSFVENK